MGAFIDVGKDIEVADFKSGKNAKGPWELMVIGDNTEKGWKKINIWPRNCPTGYQPNDKIQVSNIIHVDYKIEKGHGANGKWRDKVDVYCDVTPVHDTFDPFAPLPDDDDDEELFPL